MFKRWRNRQEDSEQHKNQGLVTVIHSRDISEPGPEEIARLRQENPFRAMTYFINNEQLDEALRLYQEVKQSLKIKVAKAVENKYDAQLAALQEELENTRQDRVAIKQQLAISQAALEALNIPPLSRAVLLEARPVPLAPKEQIAQLKSALSSLQVVQSLLDEDVPETLISLLRAKLDELEQEQQRQLQGNKGLSNQETRAPDSGEENQLVAAYRAVIAVGSARYEVNMLPKDPLPDDLELLAGRQVWTVGKAMNVIKIGQSHPTGIAAEVVKRLDDKWLHVKGRGGEEFVVQMTSKLAAVDELEAGDTVRILPGAELGLGLLEKATKKLMLDQLPTEGYDSIGGMDEQIEEIRRAIELPFLYRSVYTRYALKRPKGILLYGPPGCGKTMVAKAIARSLYNQSEKALKELQRSLTLWVELERGATVAEALERADSLIEDNMDNRAQNGGLELEPDLLLTGVTTSEEAKDLVRAFLLQRQIDSENADAQLRRVKTRLQEGAGSYFLSIKGPELLSKWVGESEYSIRRIFAAAREKASQETPVVLFFDEIESMFSRRGSGRSSDMEKTIVPQLLAEIDGVDAMPNVLVIGATNRYDLIDPAVLRPGRLDLKIRIERPNKSAARDIMSKYLTIELPIDEQEIRRIGHQKNAVSTLITRAVNVIYNPNSEVLIYHRTTKTAVRQSRKTLRQRKPLTEIVSGAMLANIVERAKRNAAEREVNREGTGMNWVEDLRPAIKQECEEGKDQYIFEARSGADEMAYLDANRFEAEVVLAEEAEVVQSVARWAHFKKRPWFR